MEEWREIESKGFKWIVSNLGRVKAPAKISRLNRFVGNKPPQIFDVFREEKILSQYITKGGYFEVAMRIDGKRIKCTVHRLVGKAFVDGYNEELSINHIDGNKLNNKPENLEWVTLAENTKHQWKTGLVNCKGDNHPNAKLNSKQVLYIRKLLREGICAHTLAIIAGVSPSTIALIRDGKRWAEIQ